MDKAPETPAVGGEGCLRSKPDFHDDPVDQLAFELAFELEDAELNPNDYVTVNREKLTAIARRVIGRITSPSPSPSALDGAVAEIAAERRRQIEAEGWTPEHDDEHDRGEMAAAAGVYALCTTEGGREALYIHGRWRDLIALYWPWSHEWWKPTSPRRDLVKAGALIVAEIERLDRAAAIRALHAGDASNG